MSTPLEENSTLIAEAQNLAASLPDAGSGTDISLGVTGAAVGDIVKVKAVDASGKPTAWEAAVMSTPELLYSGTAENVTAFEQEIDFKGHKNLVIIVGGTKGDAAISINNGEIRIDGQIYVFAYYTVFLDAASTSSTEGSIVHAMTKVGADEYKVDYNKHTTSKVPFNTYLQASSSVQTSAKTCYLRKRDNTTEEKIKLLFSASVASVSVDIYGF